LIPYRAPFSTKPFEANYDQHFRFTWLVTTFNTNLI
jgi:hypothetical protein